MQVSVELHEQDKLILDELIKIGNGAFTHQQVIDAALSKGIELISEAVVNPIKSEK